MIQTLVRLNNMIVILRIVSNMLEPKADSLMKNNWQSKIRFFTLISLLVIVVFALTYHPARAGSNTSQAPEPHTQENVSEMPTNQIIIKYKTDADQRGMNTPVSQDRMQTLNMVTGMELKYLRAMSGDAHVLRLSNRLSVDEIDDIASSIEILPDVEYAEPDYIMVPSLMPGDPQYSSQWHYFDTYGINAPAAWDITTGTNNVTIAVIDTGITDHADLTGRWVGGYDFITDIPTANDGSGRDSDPHDPGNWITFAESSSGTFSGCPVINSTWHGTHVAGIIGASGNNGVGVVGVNWVSQIVPVRVLGKCGGFTSDIADGMRWAAGLSLNGVPVNTNPAKVLNISFGGPGVCSATYQNAINAINTAGSIIIVAAGNNSSNLNTNSFQPANCNGVIPVSATDRGGDRAFYSNFGAIIKISTPRLHLSDITRGIKSKKLNGTVDFDEMPKTLQSLSVLQKLWKAINLIWNSRNRSTNEERNLAFREFSLYSIAPGTDGKIHPPKEMFIGDSLIQKIFPDIFWWNNQTQNDDPIPLSLILKYTVEESVAYLSSPPAEKVLSSWHGNKSTLQDFYHWLENHRDEITASSSLISSLKSLPIWPAGGELKPILNLYLPGGFEDPLRLASVIDISVIGGRIEFLRDVLHVKSLDFPTYVREQASPAFVNENIQPSELRDQLVQLMALRLGEIRDHIDIRLIVQRLPLIKCQNNEYYPAEKTILTMSRPVFLGVE